MKVAQTLPVAALLASSAAATGWFPACAWNDCLTSYNGTTCSSSSGWECLCTDSSALDTLNSCVATACSNSTGREAIYAAIAQVCANAGKTVTAAPEATFSATSGGSAWPSGWSTWGGSPWFSAVSSALPGAPTGWNGNGPWGGPGAGYRGPGSSGWGPCSWSTWSGWSTGTWSTGSWPTGGPGGPHGGPGGFGPPEGAPWTSFTGTWTDCSTTMAATTVPTSGVSTVTTTINGQVVTGTTFQGKGAAATGTSATGTSGSSGAANLKGMGACGALAVALVGTIMAL